MCKQSLRAAWASRSPKLPVMVRATTIQTATLVECHKNISDEVLHEITYATILDTDRFAVTMRVVNPEGEQYPRRSHVRILALDDGRELGRYEDVGTMFGARGPLVYVYYNRGHSELLVLKDSN